MALPSAAWVPLALLWAIQAQAAAPTGWVARPAPRPTLSLRSQAPDFDAMTDAERLAEQRWHLQALQQKEEKKQKQEALEDWRVKKGKAPHEEEVKRHEKEVKIDTTRARNRRDKEALRTAVPGEEDSGLLSDDAALEIDAEYTRRELEAMIRDVEAAMAAERSLQANALGESEITEDELLDLEETQTEAALGDKIQTKQILQARRQQRASLEAWRIRTGKQAHDSLQRERKGLQRAITRRRHEARAFKAKRWADVKLTPEEERALQELEVKYSNTDAAKEMERLLREMAAAEERVAAERLRKEEETDAILASAAGRGAGPTEEDLILMEDEALRQAAMEKARVKEELGERKERKAGLDKHRESVGRPTEEVLRERRDREKRLTLARDRQRGAKGRAAFTFQGPVEEDPYVEGLGPEGLAEARAHAAALAAQQWADLRDRLGRARLLIGGDPDQATPEGEGAAAATALERLEVEELEAADKETIEAKREQADRRRRAAAVAAVRTAAGRPGPEVQRERRGRERRIAMDRQRGRELKERVTSAEAQADAAGDGLALEVLDRYYEGTVEAAALAAFGDRVEAIERKLATLYGPWGPDDQDDSSAAPNTKASKSGAGPLPFGGPSSVAMFAVTGVAVAFVCRTVWRATTGRSGPATGSDPLYCTF